MRLCFVYVFLGIASSVLGQKKSWTFAFTGDIMQGTTYPDSLTGSHLPPSDGRELFQAPLPVLREADFTAGNLEGTLLAEGGQVKECRNPALCYAFRTPPDYVNNLVEAGYDFLSVANNHVNDFGEEGLVSTRETLRKAGIRFAGLRGVCESAVIEREGMSVGFCAFGHSKGTLSIMNLDEARRTVSELKRRCQLVVVSFHGGGEGVRFSHVPHGMEECFGEKRGDVVAFAHACVDAGADIVYGHGPHVVRAVELYSNRLIAYSLGNFCTPYRVNLVGKSGYAPVLTVTTDSMGCFVEGRIHSFIQVRGKGPRVDIHHRAAHEMRDLTKTDFPATPLVISSDGCIRRR
ncbi:MAG: CapA family protein [Clostridium sp.]|nr:CapA family protein [Clostridium sp.]